MNSQIVADKKDVKIYFNSAVKIAKHLVKEAIWYNDMCNWIGYEVCPVDGQFVNAVKPCGIELYSGLSGITLFLTEVYLRTKDKLVLHSIEGAINSIQHNINSNTLNNYGYYSGKIGLGFSLWKIGRKLKRAEISQQGLDIVKSVKNMGISDHEVDVVSGAAGAISVLLKLYYQENDKVFLDIALKCGQFLLDKAIVESGIYSWKTVDPNYALTGFSHGASGIASALLELYATSKQEKFWHAAMGGYSYEKKWFSEEFQNWPDLRQFTGEGVPNYGLMWCHGAPGIAIACLKAWEMTKQDYFLNNSIVALASTTRGLLKDIDSQTNANFSLCHGLAGNADVLLYASDILDDNSYREIARKVGDLGIKLYDKTNTIFPSGVNDPSGLTKGQQENPGLLLGLSGTGMFYLRLFDSMNIPSILVP